MTEWLRGFWISPSQHEEIVEELRCRINRLERDYVEIAQSLIHESEARRRAEYVRDALQRARTPQTEPKDNVIVLDTRRT